MRVSCVRQGTSISPSFSFRIGLSAGEMTKITGKPFPNIDPTKRTRARLTRNPDGSYELCVGSGIIAGRYAVLLTPHAKVTDTPNPDTMTSQICVSSPQDYGILKQPIKFVTITPTQSGNKLIFSLPKQFTEKAQTFPAKKEDPIQRLKDTVFQLNSLLKEIKEKTTFSVVLTPENLSNTTVSIKGVAEKITKIEL